MHSQANYSSATCTISDDGRHLEITFRQQRFRYHSFWLRDHGQDALTRDPGNGQKLIRVADIPQNCAITGAEIRDDKLHVQFAPDNELTIIHMQWLLNHAYDREHSRASGLLPAHATVWQHTLQNQIATISYDDAAHDDAKLRSWLQAVHRYGFAVMTGLPKKNAAVLDVIALFGQVRETNYGRYFEIRSEPDPVNLAYTSRALQCHTDNPYRDPVPGLQLFACIENSATGGESIVVDGFKIAQRLYTEDPQGFELLSTCAVTFRYNGDGKTDLLSERRMIERAGSGEIQAIHFNNRSCAAINDAAFDKMEAFYRAYRRFGELAEDELMQVKFKLAPNELFITDNTRVLHGRTAFATDGRRWMQGAYADKDGLRSKLRILSV